MRTVRQYLEENVLEPLKSLPRKIRRSLSPKKVPTALSKKPQDRTPRERRIVEEVSHIGEKAIKHPIWTAHRVNYNSRFVDTHTNEVPRPATAQAPIQPNFPSTELAMTQLGSGMEGRGQANFVDLRHLNRTPQVSDLHISEIY